MVALLVPCVAAAPLGGQESSPARPRLAAGADTNSATAYYLLGMNRLQADRPTEAAAAFLWASRLAPDWADPLYGLRVADILSAPQRLVPMMEGVRSVIGSREVLRLDSLRLRALQIDPFVYEDQERSVILRYVTERIMADLTRERGVSRAEVERKGVEADVRLYLRRPQAVTWRAWIAYSERRLDDAVKLYADALKQTPADRHGTRSALHHQRARALYLRGQHDSCARELREAIEELERRDTETLVRVYESRAMLEYSLGVALEGLQDLDGARAAYGRALVEDLAFHPAHVHLAGLLAGAGDTTGARGEYELAVQVAPTDPVARILLANHYHAGGDEAATLATLDPLIEREPYWAEPHLLRGVALERLGRRDDAVAAYARFLDTSEAGDDRRAAITRRLEALRGR